jgi:hypothetical protein
VRIENPLAPEQATMNKRLSVAIPCRVDEPGLGATLESLGVACGHSVLPAGLMAELVICINGVTPGTICVPLVAVRDFCTGYQVPLEECWLEPETHGTKGRTGERENGRRKRSMFAPMRPCAHAPMRPRPRFLAARC